MATHHLEHGDIILECIFAPQFGASLACAEARLLPFKLSGNRAQTLAFSTRSAPMERAEEKRGDPELSGALVPRA
jgi:hypothetical protein